jgi:type II secretory pathway pseudopilin PulG
MNLKSDKPKPRRQAERAMTLVEVLIATAGIGILIVSLYVSLTQGFSIIQTARENLRATQILQEKMETMRVYNWDQITGGVVPETFEEPFYAVGDNDVGGFVYRGTVTITDPDPLAGTGYSGNLRLVVAQVTWNSGQIVRTREMRTFVSQYGLHTYVY